MDAQELKYGIKRQMTIGIQDCPMSRFGSHLMHQSARGSVAGMPDLAVEIKPPSDTINGMRETAAYYLANGSRLVWVIYPEHRLVEVYRPNEDVEILNAKQILSGHDVLPNFELPIAEVFADPFSSAEDDESS